MLRKLAALTLVTMLTGCAAPFSPGRAPSPIAEQPSPGHRTPEEQPAGSATPGSTSPGGTAPGTITPPGVTVPPGTSALTPSGALLLHSAIGLAAIRLDAGDFQGALALLPPEPDPDTYAHRRWLTVRARALAATGDLTGAAGAAEAALNLALGPEVLPARLTAGEVFLAAGEPAKAARALLDAAASTASFYEGGLRDRLVDRLLEIAPALDPHRDDEQELLLRLGELLEAFGEYGPAIQLYEREGYHGDGLVDALLSIAFCYGQLGDRELAISLYQELIQPDDKHEVRLRALLAREYLLLGREDEAYEEYARVLEVSHPGPNGEVRANWYTARALEILVDRALEEGDVEAAYLWLTRAPSAALGFDNGKRAAWDTFLTAYAQFGPGHELPVAIMDLLEPQAAADAEFRFWRWRMAGEAGGDGQAMLEALLADQPLDYYGLLGRRTAEPSGCHTCFVLEGGDEVELDPDRFRVPQALMKAGMADAASGELRRHMRGEAGDWRAHYVLAEWEAEMGRYRESVGAARAAWEQSEAPVPPVPLLRRIFPDHYREVVEAEARRQNIDPLFLFSLMREESVFERMALSGSDAYGLLQLIPSTAQWMAERERMGAIPNDLLFEPAVNVRLGAAFVRWLLDWYDGNYTLAAAGYNAGPGAVDGWIEAFGTDDMALFVERIPYAETREYTKRVERNRVIYQALYGQ